MASKIVLPLLLAVIFSDGISAQRFYPVVEVNTGYLLGAVSNGLTGNADSAAYWASKPQTYNFVSIYGSTGQLNGSAAYDMGVPCEGQYMIDFSPAINDKYAIAVAGTWELLPFPVKILSPGLPVYQEATAEILRQNGISDPDVRNTMVVRTDLEGDGVDEVIICAQKLNPENPVHPSAGDYSLLYVRKLFEGKVINIMLSQFIFPEGGENHLQFTHEIVAVADVNGDGVMEIVVRSAYYEGEEFIVFSIGSNFPAIVCIGGCGV